MTDPRRQAWAPYIRDIADRLRLRDWTIELSDEGTGNDDLVALVRVADGRRFARLYLSDAFLDLTPERHRHTVVHEMLHLHFGWAGNWAREKIAGDSERDTFVRLHEIGIDGLADAIAPLMPLPGVSTPDSSGIPAGFGLSPTAAAVRALLLHPDPMVHLNGKPSRVPAEPDEDILGHPVESRPAFPEDDPA